jgi:hypothetical protein
MRKSEELTNPKSCLSKAKDDEIVFVLLARDPAAQAAIITWMDERVRLGLNTYQDQKLIDASETSTAMQKQRLHGIVYLGE